MQVWNIKKILEWTTIFFESKGVQHPRLSAELLLSSVLKLTRMQLYLNYDYVLNPEELGKYKELIIKRAKHVPVQYILNQAHFRNLELYVDENVMIPRPETELLVDKALSLIIEIAGVQNVQNGAQNMINILEVGVGSGAISISIAQEIDEKLAKTLLERKQNMLSKPDEAICLREISWNIVATDNSASALEVARKNASRILEREKLEKVEFAKGDIIPDNSNFVEKYRKSFNLIVSNPPYVSEKDYVNLPREVKDYEPKSSLVGGETGVEMYEKIILKTKPFYSEEVCYIVFEIDSRVRGPMIELVKEILNPKVIEVHKDYNKLDRIVVIRAN